MFFFKSNYHFDMDKNPRTQLINAAMRIMETQGPSQIKARAVAAEAGISTMGVYTHFGGVPELLQALANEGFIQQFNLFQSVSGFYDPMTNLCLMALKCRDFAIENSHLYDLMFGLSIQGRYTPHRSTSIPTQSESNLNAFQMSYALLLSECKQLIQQGNISSNDPDIVSSQLWSALHGFIMLELGQHFQNCKNPTIEVLVPTCINIIVGMGADRQLAELSANKAISIWQSSK